MIMSTLWERASMSYLIMGGAEAFKKDTKKNLGAGIKVSGSNLVPIFQALQHYEAVLNLGAEEKCKAVCAVLSKCNNWYVKKDDKLKHKKTKTLGKRSVVVGTVLKEAMAALKTYDPSFYKAVESYHKRKNAVKMGGALQTKTMAVGYVNERVSYLAFNKQTSMAAGFVREGFEKDPHTYPLNSPRRAFQGTFQDTFDHTNFDNLTAADWLSIHNMANALDQQKVSVRYMKKFERMNHMLQSDGNGGLQFVVGARSAQGDGWPYAMDEWGSIYTADNKLGTNTKGKRFFNHSTFTAGDVVVCAGELTIDAHARLVKINNASGHYKPTADHLKAVLTILRDDYGVDITVTRVSVDTETTHQEWNTGDRFLADALPDVAG